MSNHTQSSAYLLNQEHITDREIDELYDFANELKLQLDNFRQADVKYRSLENVNTKQSEEERTAILNACAIMIGKLTQALEGMQGRSSAILELFNKAKGALEEKVEME
jgi:outer membrane protein assembly factor BamD (BamD/ComL family)